MFAFRLSNTPHRCSHHTNRKGQLSGLPQQNSPYTAPTEIHPFSKPTHCVLTFHVCDQQEGHGEEAGLVILLPNPQASPWEINVLYCGLVPFCCVLFLDRTMLLLPQPHLLFLFWFGCCIAWGQKGNFCYCLLNIYLVASQTTGANLQLGS